MIFKFNDKVIPVDHGWVIWGYGVSSIYGNKKKGGGVNGGITVTCTCNAIFKICNCNQV